MRTARRFILVTFAVAAAFWFMVLVMSIVVGGPVSTLPLVGQLACFIVLGVMGAAMDYDLGAAEQRDAARRAADALRMARRDAKRAARERANSQTHDGEVTYQQGGARRVFPAS